MDQDVQPAELLADSLEDRVEVLIPSDVARKNERAVQGAGEVANARLEPFTLESESQPSASTAESLGYRPGNTAAIGYAENNSRLTL